MISIENFYWILFENLCKPVGLDCWYYYPWGTKENLSLEEFKHRLSRRDYNHVFCHYDQEPLWINDLGPYDLFRASYDDTCARILANSEHSALKKEVCKQRGLIDWYFFYHGFAALDWYSDARYMPQNHPIWNAFLSFNHVFDHRSYRVALLARLLDRNIAHKGSISFHADLHDIKRELQDPDTLLSIHSRALIQKNMDRLADLPWHLDRVPINGDLSARFGHSEYKLWQSSLWHVVNETVFYDSKLHLTEKVFKPIVAQRPFVLVAAPGNLDYLRGYGFKSFDRWIDESYDTIEDPDQRLDAVVKEINRFAKMTIAELRDIHQDMMPVLEYNKQHFFGKFREIIVGELVDNFDTCVRIWNNGRVDDRGLNLHPDLESVKQILLR
jgi:hypothetical protein